MNEISNPETFYEAEKLAGPPDLEPLDPEIVDKYRQMAYESYEQYLRSWLRQLDKDRLTLWQRNYSNCQNYLESIEAMRDLFKRILGFWIEPEERPAIKPLDEEVLIENENVIGSRFKYEIMPGLFTYALRLVPKTPAPHPGLLVQHGYTATPELACGLAASSNQTSYRSLGLRAAINHNYHVIAPYHPSGFGNCHDAIDSPLPGYENHDFHYGKNRLHRFCICGGGTLLGLDMFACSRAIDLLLQEESVDSSRIGMYGISRGGQSALYLPAMDQRIKASVSSAYFNNRLDKMVGPYSKTTYIDWFSEGQFITGLIRYFADSDIVSLIAPRAFAVESGVLDTAVDQAAARAEYNQALKHYDKLGIGNRLKFIAHKEGHVSATAEAFKFLAENLPEVDHG